MTPTPADHSSSRLWTLENVIQHSFPPGEVALVSTIFFGLDNMWIERELAACAFLPFLGGVVAVYLAFFVENQDAIASFRPHLMHDAVFLSRVVSARSTDLLAHFLSIFHKRDSLFESVPKKRKIQCDRQEALWGEDGTRDVSTWSASRLPCV